LDDDLWLVIHLMIAGRLHWRSPGSKTAGRNALAAFDFPDGTLVLSEAGTKRRASLHVFRGEEALAAADPGGIDVMSSDLPSFRTALAAENRTLKRALTDSRIVSGIGNAYSDEILHAARLSPLALTSKLDPDEWATLFTAVRDTLKLWMDRLRDEAINEFPEKVTAFRKDMAVHGRFGLPCPAAGKRSNASATPTRKPTTAPGARRTAECSRIAACPASLERTGLGPWRNWRCSHGPPDRRRSPRNNGEPVTPFQRNVRFW
jgi:formamidopyrimidine-DNA glycosylase